MNYILKVKLGNLFDSSFNRATLVEHEDGKRTLLSKTDPNQREAIAKRLLTPSTEIRASVSPCKKVMAVCTSKPPGS